jgi:hypothetical protein
VAAAKELPDPISERARFVIQAVTETLADLRNRPDAGQWTEQITTLEAMRDRLVAELSAAENAA